MALRTPSPTSGAGTSPGNDTVPVGDEESSTAPDPSVIRTPGSIMPLTIITADPTSVPAGEPASPVPDATSTPTPQPSPTPIATLRCPTPDPVETAPPGNQLRIDAPPGGIVFINADELVSQVPAGDGLEYAWRQITMEQDSLEYVTNRPIDIGGSNSSRATFVPEVPGLYRLEVSIRSESSDPATGQVDVYVAGSIRSRLDVFGIAFPDVFGSLGGPEFDVAPDDPECRPIALDHAYSVTDRLLANWAGFTPATFLIEFDPLRYETVNNALSLTDDAYYAALVGAAQSRGLSVWQAEQDAPHFDLAEGK